MLFQYTLSTTIITQSAQKECQRLVTRLCPQNKTSKSNLEFSRLNNIVSSTLSLTQLFSQNEIALLDPYSL